MNKKVEKKKVRYTPPRRAVHWQKGIGRNVRKLIMLFVVAALIGLMFSGLQSIGIPWLVALLSVAIMGGLSLLFLNEGMSTGVQDTEVSRRVEKMEKEGRHIVKEDDEGCYSPVRAIVSAVLVFIIPVCLAFFVALNSAPYTYTMQDLPSWLSGSYGNRSDVMTPLGAYMQTVGMTAVDWCRLVVRVLGMICVNIFPDPQTQVLAVDWSLPFFFMLYPLVYVIGYLRGPYRQAVLARKQRRAKKVAVKKAQKKTLAEQLTSTGAEVHYGQRNDREDEKKRLI